MDLTKLSETSYGELVDALLNGSQDQDEDQPAEVDENVYRNLYWSKVISILHCKNHSYQRHPILPDL